MSGNDRKEMIMEFIVSYNERNQVAPSYQEIAKAVGLASTSSVSRYIDQLRREGRLDRAEEGARRTLGIPRRITLLVHDEDSCKRVTLILADGGSVSFDCTMGNGDGAINFTGILDASELNHPVGRIVQVLEEK